MRRLLWMCGGEHPDVLHNRVSWKLLCGVANSAQKMINSSLPSLEDISTSRCRTRAMNITAGPTHPAHELFTLLPSGRRLRSLRARTTRLRCSFFPKAVSLMNSWTLPWTVLCTSPSLTASYPNMSQFKMFLCVLIYFIYLSYWVQVTYYIFIITLDLGDTVCSSMFQHVWMTIKISVSVSVPLWFLGAACSVCFLLSLWLNTKLTQNTLDWNLARWTSDISDLESHPFRYTARKQLELIMTKEY